jgi:hypothetical protein
MNASQVRSIHAAAASAAAAVSRNVAECPEMSEARTRLRKTKPSAASPLSPRQLAAIALLFAGHSTESAARVLGICARTIFRWKRDPRFAGEIERRAAALAAETASRSTARPKFTPPRPPPRPGPIRSASPQQRASDLSDLAAMVHRYGALPTPPVAPRGSAGVAVRPEMSRNVIPAHAKTQNEPKPAAPLSHQPRPSLHPHPPPLNFPPVAGLKSEI